MATKRLGPITLMRGYRNAERRRMGWFGFGPARAGGQIHDTEGSKVIGVCVWFGRYYYMIDWYHHLVKSEKKRFPLLVVDPQLSKPYFGRSDDDGSTSDGDLG